MSINGLSERLQRRSVDVVVWSSRHQVPIDGTPAALTASWVYGESALGTLDAVQMAAGRWSADSPRCTAMRLRSFTESS